jgi:hypothetical protein
MAKKPASTVRKKRDSGLHQEVQNAIESGWPDGVVHLLFDSENSWFWKVQPKLKHALARIAGGRLVYELEADGKPIWDLVVRRSAPTVR